MKASTLNGKEVLIVNKGLKVLAKWKILLEKLMGFFDAELETDWDKRFSANWREWGRHT